MRKGSLITKCIITFSIPVCVFLFLSDPVFLSGVAIGRSRAADFLTGRIAVTELPNFRPTSWMFKPSTAKASTMPLHVISSLAWHSAQLNKNMTAVWLGASNDGQRRAAQGHLIHLITWPKWQLLMIFFFQLNVDKERRVARWGFVSTQQQHLGSVDFRNVRRFFWRRMQKLSY